LCQTTHGRTPSIISQLPCAIKFLSFDRCERGNFPLILQLPIDHRRFGAAPAMMVPRRCGATNTTLAATQLRRTPPPIRGASETERSQRSPSQNDTNVTISLTHSRARGADDGGRRRRDASYGVARDSHPVSTIR
jgi:hypothetical protein